MSGIFRYNSQTSTTTPDKRWTISPFCVSPGQLQDVTTESPFSFGCRSPFFAIQNNGTVSPSQGRSVREFEEQMATLRKENFNLKLRIYFLEEKIPGLNQMNTPEGQESLMKQYIDSKVDTEMLRKDLEDKQQILKEAADALTHMENIQKETEIKNQQIIDELNQKIQILEIENQTCQKSFNNDETLMNDLIGRTNLEGDDIAIIQKFRELEGALNLAEEKINQLTIKSKNLETIISNKDEIIEKLEMNKNELNFQNLELKEVLDSNDQLNIQRIREELDKCRSQLADKMCEIDELKHNLREKSLAYDESISNLETLIQNTKLMKNEIEQLKMMPTFRLSVNKENFTTMQKSLSDSECCYLKDSLDESWTKKLNLHNASKGSNEKIENIDSIILEDEFKLPSSLSGSENNNLSDREIETIEDQLKRFDSETLIKQLQFEIDKAKEDAENANKWRKECADVCVILTSRLEELAGFLDSLLKHKEILNAVASDRRRAMRKAIDKSLNLSRTLTGTAKPSDGISFNQSSFNQLTNFSRILNIEDNENSHYNIINECSNEVNNEILERLKLKINLLKNELDQNKQTIKKDRRSLLSSYNLDLSESETWSEPDRNVSLARIGLDEGSFTLSKGKKYCRDETKHDTPKNSTESSSNTESNDLTRKSKSNSKEKINLYEQLILIKDNKILEIQCELMEADSKLKNEAFKLAETKEQLNNYKVNNELLQKELISIKTQSKNFHFLKSNEENLRQELINKTSELNKLQDERNRLEIDVRVAETHIENLKSEITKLKEQHDKHIKSLQNNEKERFSQMHLQLQDLLKENLKELEFKHQETITRDWISKQEYNNAKNQIEKLEEKLSQAESTIEYLNENETELKNHLIENEKSVRALRRTLDETTLSVSKAILERTKALNEKLKFENKLQELTKDFEALLKEKNLLEEKLKSVKSSGYASEEINAINQHESQGNRRLENSSPDLGIDSDPGRQSNTDTNENNQICNKIEDTNNNNHQQLISLSQILTLPTDHDCSQVHKENLELRAKLKRTIRQYEETLKRLRTANQLKEQVERDIRQQLHKTNIVLKNVRTNIETNLETIHKKNQ